MADQSQPIYSWRPTGTQQASNYFGTPQSFGSALNSAVQGAGGAQSPFTQAKPNDGFNIPGGSSAGFGDAGFSAASPAGAPAPSSFGSALRTNPLSQPFPTSQQQMTDAAGNAAMQNLQPNQGPSMSSMFALNEYNKGESEALRQAKESSALNGRADTGQIAGDVSNTLSQKLIPARQNFLGQLQGQEEQQNITKQQNAQGNIQSLIGQANQADQFKASQAQQESQFGRSLALNTTLGMGDLSLREKTLAQGASQFKDQLSFQKYATDKGFTNDEAQRAWQATQNQAQLASSEKVAFAGLDQQKAQLAQQAMQFTSNLDFQKWATSAGLDAETQKQVWQATQNEKDRQLQAGQGDLSRTLQKYIADQGFNMDSKKLETQIQQFTSQQDFQKWATQAGLDADTQKLIWQGNQNDIQRKQDIGMQLTANEQQVRMQGLQSTHDEAMAGLNHTLNLDTLQKQQANEVRLKNMDQSFQSLMTSKGYSHDEAMAATKQSYEKELLNMGYDQQTAMQASDQWFQGQQADKQLAQSKYLAEAQMSQQYGFFMSDLQQKYDFKQADVDQAKATLSQQASQFAQSFGLDQQKFSLLKGTQEFQNLTDMTATLTTMAGDNPDMLQFAAENFYKGMANMKNPDGSPVMDSAGISKGLLGISAGAWKGTAADFTAAKTAEKNPDGSPKYSAADIANAAGAILAPGSTSKQSVDSFNSMVDSAGAFATPEEKDQFKATMLNYSKIAANLPKVDGGGVPDDDPEVGGMLNNGYQKLKAMGVDTSRLFASQKVGMFDTHTTWQASQPAMDYSIFIDMQNKGLGTQAEDALMQLLGPERAKAALSLDPSWRSKAEIASSNSVGQYQGGTLGQGIGYLSA